MRHNEADLSLVLQRPALAGLPRKSYGLRRWSWFAPEAVILVVLSA